jgi:hypothetical protein
MVPFLRERRSKQFLIGGHGWDRLSPEYVSRFELLIAEHGLTSTHQVATAFLTVQESLLYMMAADVVVSTSSSFTDIVALFSAFPVVINPPPKHGFSLSSIEYVNHFSLYICFNILRRYLPDGVFVDGWTMSSKPDYVQNIYRSSEMTPAQAVSHALFKRLEIRFPASKR